MRISHRLALHALWIATALRLLVPSAADPDLWGHLLFGDVFLHAGIVSTNGFAYTTPAHPWIDHELGAEAVMAAVYAARPCAAATRRGRRRSRPPSRPSS